MRAGPPPTIEQMENLAIALGLGSVLYARRAPHYERSLRNLHTLAQRALNGDEEAEAALGRLRAKFGTSLLADGAVPPREDE